MIDFDGSGFIAEVDQWQQALIRSAPQAKFDRRAGHYKLPATFANAMFLKKEFNGQLSSTATAKIVELKNYKTKKEKFPRSFKFKTKPRSHQQEAIDFGWPLVESAFLMEMRTGKTWVAITLAAARAAHGKINALVVVCPTSVKPVWKIELERHCSIEYEMLILEAGSNKIDEFATKPCDKLKVIIVGIESLSQGKAILKIKNFMAAHKCYAVIDESSRIKNFKSIRTEACYRIGDYAAYRSILTGTVLTQGLHDFYSQFAYLNWKIIGQKSFYTFKNRYCISGGFKNKQIVGYMNISELIDLVTPYTYSCLARNVIDLPREIFEQRYVNPTAEQKRAMKELKDLMETSVEGFMLEVENTLERTTRYQQISGGMFPYIEDKKLTKKGWKKFYKSIKLPGGNPKLDDLFNVIDELGDQKIIIWARFRPELELIEDALIKKFGDQCCVMYVGGQTTNERIEVLKTFQENPLCRFFLGNQQTAGMGLELSAASAHVFFSNSFSYEDRKQAMARTNSSQQTAKSILYIDIMLDHPEDKRPYKAFCNKKDMADYVSDRLNKQMSLDD